MMSVYSIIFFLMKTILIMPYTKPLWIKEMIFMFLKAENTTGWIASK